MTGTCQNCKKETELVPTTDVCEPCLLELSMQWDFCDDHLLSYRKGKRCAVCAAGYPPLAPGQPTPDYPPEVAAQILEMARE